MSKIKKTDLIPSVRAKEGTRQKIEELAKRSRRELAPYLRLIYEDAIIKQTIL